ncbi:hypothetical protein Noc_A0016 (plasmid) [Nitrosococcus oceani ATCC 19707]|uniref:Uncharacterized protein n=2 Tax=Nitrosococcus oceani TaxID=1229 RepID=Q3JF67_NITOC|nr:hypothetical protein [Nitrosococcus oceani]ABA56529.1 hypothetical protein Noc_A0016 [Nitrosococcus oceani ATCC 19707]EDZ65250.1 hypothetical protein NOC27_3414 [Nitrosococcus oceani AFC27]KFI17795.1 hypothetical protein IB75_18735 [Nitrosococcus oceani C-27]BBM60805.1 hypothetical protein NONS58_P0190 [Nitrosococcus oceani]
MPRDITHKKSHHNAQGPRAMTDDELISEFTRLAERDGKTVLEVGVVTWGGAHSHSPELSWKAFRQWSRPPTNERLAAAQMKALETSRFFRVCRHCKERVNAGHMLDQEICQSCAEKELGVTF